MNKNNKRVEEIDETENEFKMEQPPMNYQDDEIKEPAQFSKKSLVTEKQRDLRKNHLVYKGFNQQTNAILQMIFKKIKAIDAFKQQKGEQIGPVLENEFKLVHKSFETIVAKDPSDPCLEWTKAFETYIQKKRK